MAWTSINAACGHTYQEQLYGPHRDRDRKAEWLGTRECPDCYTARLERERAEATTKATEANRELPALTGSPKQIAWAETIRTTKVAQLHSLQTRLQGEADRVDVAYQIIAVRLNKTEAKYWIENRGTTYDIEWLRRQIAKTVAPVTV